MMLVEVHTMSDVLRRYHLKSTKKRESVLTILDNAKTPLPIESIHALATLHTPMNLSTVYRTITVLYAHHIVLKTINQDGTAYYSLNRHKHEHLLICKNCNKIIIVAECPLHELECKLEKQTGFIIEDHRLEFIGLCPQCQQLHKKE